MWCKLLPNRLRTMMPQDSLSLALTTGFGFSVLAGLVSGVVYIISIGYNKTKRPPFSKPDTPWHCNFCGAQFRSIDGVLESEQVITCMKCNRKYCKEKCAKPIDETAASALSALPVRWICKKCQPDSWLTGIVRLLQLNETKDWYTKKMTAQQAQLNVELSELQRKEREKVRDFIERLVEALLGGELDNVSVKKIYNDERYDAIYSRYHGDLSAALTDLGSALHITISNLPIAGESPCSAHASLKNLIQRFIREASELPELRKIDEDHPAIPDDTNDRTYEDLLSTAVINKVVQNYQNQAPSVSGNASNKSYKRSSSDKEYFLGERNLDKFTDDTSSLSSLDDYISTNGSTKYFDQMNLAIQQSIEEVSSSDDDEPEPENLDIDEVDSSSVRNNEWQENWYLRKRNFASGANSPVPVPMLVPNPTNNAKVLIGDREVDDTSDLSDAMSDYEDTAEPSSLNAVLVNSKTIIGGRNPLESLVAKAESISDGSIDDVDKSIDAQTKVLVHVDVENVDNLNQNVNGSLEFNSDENSSGENDVLIETCNNAMLHHVIDHDIDDAGACADVDDHSLMSLESNTEKDSEYTEKYATLPRKIPMPAPRQSKLSEIDFTNTTLLIEDSKTDNGDSGVTSDEDEKQKSFKGSSYGEREKDKWNHAINLPNNPYSKSNLERRLSNRSSSVSSLNSAPNSPTSENVENNKLDSVPPLTSEMSKSLFDIFNEDRKSSKHRFGPDYFAKAAGKPQGALKKEWDNENDAEAEEEETNAPIPVDEPDDPIIPNENIFRAVPALIQVDDDVKYDIETSSIEFSTPLKKPQPWGDFSSDSDYSIERTYNINSGKIIKKHGDVEYEVPTNEQNEGLAEGLKYTPKKFDENQNTISPVTVNDTRLKRSQFLRSLTSENDDEDYDDFMVSPVTPPAVNHFKLVNEIANETSDQYHIVPISPPAEYKTEEVDQVDSCDVPNHELEKGSIEYEINEKSYDFSIEDDYNDEEIKKQNEQINDVIYEESLPGQLYQEKPNEGQINDTIFEESLPGQLYKEKSKKNEDANEQIDLLIYETLPGQLYQEKSNEVQNDIIYEESLPGQLYHEKPNEKQINDIIFEESLPGQLYKEKSKNNEDANELIDLLIYETLPGQLYHETNNYEDEVDVNDVSLVENVDEKTIAQKNISNELLNEIHYAQNIELDIVPRVQPEVEMDMLKEKQIVKNLLGAYSKSYPNLNATTKCDQQEHLTRTQTSEDINYGSDFTENDIEIEDASLESVPSVQNLKKMFEKESDVKKEVHSLTARSLPKHVRQELAAQSTVPMAMPRSNSVLSEASVEQEEENVEFPRAKNKIAYFEQMSNK